jgi:hypothetical protein
MNDNEIPGDQLMEILRRFLYLGNDNEMCELVMKMHGDSLVFTVNLDGKISIYLSNIYVIWMLPMIYHG